MKKRVFFLQPFYMFIRITSGESSEIKYAQGVESFAFLLDHVFQFNIRNVAQSCQVKKIFSKLCCKDVPAVLA